MFNNIDNTTKILLGVFALAIAYVVFTHFNIKHKFESDEVKKAITTGVIVEFNRGGKNAPDFQYKFKVDGIVYESRHDIVTKLSHKSGNELRKYIGKKYQVWYVVEDPSYNRLLLDKPIKDN